MFTSGGLWHIGHIQGKLIDLISGTSARAASEATLRASH
jgi:hypothetical protein